MKQPYAIGVDVGGTNIRAAQITANGDILSRKVVQSSRMPEQAQAQIVRLIQEMGCRNASAIGVGIPGRVNGYTGEILSGGFIDLSGVDLTSLLSTEFEVPVVVANDCSMALIGEHRNGAASDVASSVMLTIGTGIGGAIMEKGRIVNGKRCAGQLGHLVVNLNGHLCHCGQVGCIETESSGTALGRHIREAGFNSSSRFEDVLLLAQTGNQIALGVLHSWVEPLRAAIHSLSATLDPDVIILGGGMGGAAFSALSFLEEDHSWYRIPVRAAVLGDDAGVIGCGIAALDLA